MKVSLFYHHKDIEKQINSNLLGGTIAIVAYVLLGYFNHIASTILRAVLLFHIAYVFVVVVLLTKKWVEKSYR